MALNESEWKEYIGLIVSFGVAKMHKRYDESDALREKLLRWQENMPDIYFLDMWKYGKFEFHPAFEQQGDGSNRHLRHQKRQTQMATVNM